MKEFYITLEGRLFTRAAYKPCVCRSKESITLAAILKIELLLFQPHALCANGNSLNETLTISMRTIAANEI